MTLGATDPWQEPVRGEPLTPAAFGLDGIERLRGWGRRWPSTPMARLLGIRTTQVVSGSAVSSMPVTPWLQHPDGVIEIGFLADTVCGVAADTVLKAGSIVVPVHAGYRPLRPVSDTCRTLVGRASVVRTSPDWVFVEGQLEDDEGRAIARSSLHAAVRPVSFPIPDTGPDTGSGVDPSFPTPDPYRRPVPADKFAVVDRFNERGCIETFEAIACGDAVVPPLYSLLGIRPTHASTGSVVTEMTTTGWLRSVDPNDVTASFLRTQAVSAGVAAIWTITPDGYRPAILDFTTTLMTSAPADGRRIVARATAEQLSGDMMSARVDTTDGDAHLSVSHVSVQLRPRGRASVRRPSRSLTTVLFTDVVGSTASAERLGDASWSRLLERHQVLVRSHLEEHHGREVKTTGDGFLATFDSPTAALECASAIRDDLRKLGIEIRAGVHTGEVELMGGDVAGIAVHLAARIESVTGPGQVWASETVRSLTMGSHLTFRDLGPHVLKGIDGEIRLYAVER